MKNMKLTTKGKEILQSVSADGESRYWIGYYGLAYVPDHDEDPLEEAASQNELTTSDYSDRIYNIWQGDMLNGYAQANPETGEAASLFGLTMYDKSIRTNYRYVYDAENERNQLVAWKSVNTGHGEDTTSRSGAAVYKGGYRNGSGLVESQIPVPAPLFYNGEPVDNATEPSESVSSDYRFYTATRDNTEYGWKDSSDTYANDAVYTPDNLLQSVSNFNKFHGTVSSEGYGVSSVSSCHNMSKATKLFPINYYQVINDNGDKLAETKYSEDSPAKKPLATGIKFSIDLSPVTVDTGYTALDYDDGGDTANKDLFESKYVSFRFNRIGIYAVKMTVHHYSTESATSDCNMQKVQFEIDGDEEPVLFAVADVNDVIISDNPSSDEKGVAKFTLDFILNIGEANAAELERSTAVFYNLYENDAATWYKNQLLASASISEAVTDLSIELNAMKRQMNGSQRECCAQTVDTSRNVVRQVVMNPVSTSGNMVDLVDGTSTEETVVLKTLADEAITSWDCPAGIDPIAEIQTILGNHDVPVIHFTVEGCGDCFAHLCNVNYCGYMFSTYLAGYGHRNICVRYSNSTSMTAGHMYVTMSEHNIRISDGTILS